jgi:hypothetical protein
MMVFRAGMVPFTPVNIPSTSPECSHYYQEMGIKVQCLPYNINLFENVKIRRTTFLTKEPIKANLLMTQDYISGKSYFGGTTSVGTATIERFWTLKCYQDMPKEQLPAALRNENPDKILRMVNGKYTKDAILTQ